MASTIHNVQPYPFAAAAVFKVPGLLGSQNPFRGLAGSSYFPNNTIMKYDFHNTLFTSCPVLAFALMVSKTVGLLAQLMAVAPNSRAAIVFFSAMRWQK